MSLRYSPSLTISTPISSATADNAFHTRRELAVRVRDLLQRVLPPEQVGGPQQPANAADMARSNAPREVRPQQCPFAPWAPPRPVHALISTSPLDPRIARMAVCFESTEYLFSAPTARTL